MLAAPESGFSFAGRQKCQRSFQPVLRPSVAAIHPSASDARNNIKRQTIIRRLTHAEETLRAVGHLRPARANRTRSARASRGDGPRSLPDRGTRATVAEIFERALQLPKDPEVRRGVEIGVKQVALKEKPIVIRRLLVEHRLGVEFVFKAGLAAEGEIPVSVGVERNVFRRVKKIGALGRVAQERPVLVIAQVWNAGRSAPRRNAQLQTEDDKTSLA